MTQKKISNYIRFFVLLLPIFALLGAILRNGQLTSLDTFYNDYFDSLPQLFIDFRIYLTTNFGFDSTMFYISYAYLVYVFITEFVMLIFDFILFIPRWIRGLIFSYEKKNKN